MFYHIVYPIAILIGRIVWLWGRWQVTGRENVPRKGGLIVVANHMSSTDIPLLGINLGRKAAFVAKEELFRSRISRWLMRGLGSFPVRRGQVNMEAIRTAQSMLADGKAIVMFPEGARYAKTRLEAAFTGPVLIAIRSGAPVLPVGISGTEQLRAGIASALHRPRVTINIGRPFRLTSDDGTKLTKEKRAELADIMVRHIAELLPPEYRGTDDRGGRHR